MISKKISLSGFLTLSLFVAFSIQGPLPGAEAAAAQPPKSDTVATAAKKKPAAKTTAAVKAKPKPGDADYEPTRDGPQTGGGPSGAFGVTGMTDISDNPGFFMVPDKKPEAGVPQDLDSLIRPALKRLFKDAKLVEEFGEQPPALDGEVVENKLVYAVRQLLAESDGDQLHTELHDKMKWPASPRLGRKPTHIRGHQKVWMSLFKSTRLRGYSLVIEVNYGTQRITVTSYRLGSKYDRLM